MFSDTFENLFTPAEQQSEMVQQASSIGTAAETTIL